MEKAMTLARVKSVAGVRIPDTALCNAAVDLLESCSPAFLCSHCLRTYIFGSLAVRGIGRSVVDEEAAWCGARFPGSRPRSDPAESPRRDTRKISAHEVQSRIQESSGRALCA